MSYFFPKEVRKFLLLRKMNPFYKNWTLKGVGEAHL